MTLSDRLRSFLRERVALGDLSAGTARVVADGEVVASSSVGWSHRGFRIEADEKTLFDAASLTKVVTATLALILHRDGKLPLDTKVGDLFPEARSGLAEHPFEEALRHATGLAAWVPLYAIDRHPADALRQVLEGAFPPVVGARYSDLGYIVWGRGAERATGIPLTSLLYERVLRPLGMESTLVLPGQRPDVAECFLDNGREVELAARKGILLLPEVVRRQGIPQDGNARFLGGLGGHAGLFTTLDDLVRLAEEWIDPGTLLDPALVGRALAGDGHYALGWWRPQGVSAITRGWSERSFGMFGFVGGVLWIDPDRRLVAALLGHRLKSGRSAEEWRREFLEIVGG